MRRMSALLVGILSALLIVVGAGCGTGSSARPSPSMGPPTLRAKLSGLLGSRLGRLKTVGKTTAFIEVRGTVSERELFEALLLMDEWVPQDDPVTIAVLSPDHGWRQTRLTWDSSSGRLERQEGTGDDALVTRFPLGESVATAYEADVAHVIRSGVDQRRIRSFADGAAPQWAKSK